MFGFVSIALTCLLCAAPASATGALQETLATIEALWQAGDRRASLAQLERYVVEHPEEQSARRLLVERELAVHRYAKALESMRPNEAFRKQRATIASRPAGRQRAQPAFVYEHTRCPPVDD